MRDFSDYDGYWLNRGDETVIPRWKVAAERIPDGATVLDVGCGTGGFLSHLREVRPRCRTRGIDISPRAVAAAVEAGHDALVADLVVDDLPGVYDVITCFETIEHIPEAEVVLEKIRDACDGLIIMSLPNFGFIDHRIRLALFGRFPDTNIKFHAKEHVRHWTVRDFKDWTRQYGLEVVSVEGQYGSRKLPWRRFPGLFSRQLIYTLRVAGRHSLGP
jgi:methionine biosynthesis protein MetW